MPATIQLAAMESFGLRDDDLAREAARLQRLRHPNVLRFFGIVISPPGPMKLVSACTCMRATVLNFQ